jgi:integrase
MPDALHKPKKLTEEGVAKLKPPTDRQYESRFDALVPGLILRVNSGGAKVWHALYTKKTVNKDGERISIQTSHRLGRYPILSVKQARDAARAFLVDPQKALVQADSGSFREVAENFIKRHVEANKLRWQPEIERCLAKYIYPAWEHRPFRELKRQDVAALLDKIEDKNGPRQADIVLAIISKMCNWYAARSDDYVSPVVRGMGRSNGHDRKRKRILADDEIRAVWKAADEMGTFGAIVKCCLLTAQRIGKVMAMRRDHLKDSAWHIPSEPREKSTAGTLRLPPMLIEVIDAQPRIAGNSYVFAVGGGQGMFNSLSQRKAEFDAKLKLALPDMPPWIIHDLRRTAKSLMARAGVRPDISERVLGHVIPGVEGVYDQHTYDPEKADALQRLADLIALILNPPADNVVALAPKRGRG